MYRIVETLADGTEKSRGNWPDEEYSLLMQAWNDWLEIAKLTSTMVRLYRDGEVRITYDQREVR